MCGLGSSVRVPQPPTQHFHLDMRRVRRRELRASLGLPTSHKPAVIAGAGNVVVLSITQYVEVERLGGGRDKEQRQGQGQWWVRKEIRVRFCVYRIYVYIGVPPGSGQRD